MLKKNSMFIIPCEKGSFTYKNWTPSNMKDYESLLKNNNILEDVWLNSLPIPNIWNTNDKKKKEREKLKIKHNTKILEKHFKNVFFENFWQPSQIDNFLFKQNGISYFICKV